MNLLIDLVEWALPAGSIGAVISYLFTRRTRNNDFLEKLQHSIDLLTEKYTAVLDANTKLLEENCKLKAEKADMVEGQRQMTLKIEKLTKQVQELNKKITQLESSKNESKN